MFIDAGVEIKANMINATDGKERKRLTKDNDFSYCLMALFFVSFRAVKKTEDNETVLAFWVKCVHHLLVHYLVSHLET